MTSIRNRIPDILTGHMLAAAPTGGGKSHGIGKLVEELHETNRPFVILDTKMINHVGLAIGLNKTLSEKSPKRVKIFRVFPDTELDTEDYMRMLDQIPYLLIIPVKGTPLANLVRENLKVMTACQRLEQPRHIIIEEAHHYLKSPQNPMEEMAWIFREGRTYRIWGWALTQRIQSFPKDVWANCYWSYLMRFHIPQDISYCAALIPNFGDINEDLNHHDILLYDMLRRKKPPYEIIRANEIKRKTQHLG